ncbi:MAG TPA: homocysteine S-methyltransferase [Gemmatimonadales bacterium]|nr:homocysteine S-methyltransferase [Gemmatimonadales bacterium]
MSAPPLAELLESQGYVVLDGGLATELERRGADLADPLWSARQLVEGPDFIREVHEAYFAAGADVAVSASYQASIAGFAARGIGFQDAVRLMALSVELAKEARERFWNDPSRAGGRAWPLVAASIGPYGASLADGSEYRGNYGVSRQELADFHRPRLAAVMTARPDLLAIETIPSAEEAVLVLELLAPWPEIRAWVSFTCQDSSRIGEGTPVADAIAAVAGHPLVAAVGFNCVPPSLAEELLAGAARVTARPLVIYPNSGERWDAGRRRWIPGEGPFDFGAGARRWRERGARLIGGCCRTGPETIRAIRASLQLPAD